MLQHRFLSSTSSSLKRYHFSTSRLLCKVGTIFDIPTSLFSTNTTKKLETLVQQYFYYCGCVEEEKVSVNMPFSTLLLEKNLRANYLSNATLFCTTTSVLPPIFPSKQLILSSPPSLPQGMKNSCFLSPTILTTSQCIICLLKIHFDLR